jgi:hypothetical protein
MTKEQLDTIRDLHAQGYGIFGTDLRALLDEVERLTAREESLVKQVVAQIGFIGRQAEWREGAFKRGAEAMREAAVAVANKRATLPVSDEYTIAWCRSAACIEDELRTLTIPEEK